MPEVRRSTKSAARFSARPHLFIDDGPNRIYDLFHAGFIFFKWPTFDHSGCVHHVVGGRFDGQVGCSRKMERNFRL